jgi:hypothetical protein
MPTASTATTNAGLAGWSKHLADRKPPEPIPGASSYGR